MRHRFGPRFQAPAWFAIALALAAALGNPGAALGTAPTPGNTELNKAFAHLHDWRFGADYSPLRRIGEWVRQNSNRARVARRLARRLRAVVLDRTATVDAKRFACRQLATIGTAADVPALAALLPDPALSHMARYALQRIPGKKAEAALIAGLAAAPPLQKIGILNSLGERRSAAATSTIERYLGNSNPAVAGAAAAALGKIAAPEAFRALAKVWQTPPAAGGPDRVVLFDALLRCAAALARQGRGREVADAVENLYEHAAAPSRRAAAFGVLVQALGVAAVDRIVHAAEARDPILQSVALEYAQKLPGGVVTDALAKRLPTLPPPARVRLLTALAKRGDRRAATAVRAQIKAREPAVRRAALAALARIGDPECIPALAAAAAAGTGRERRAAREALARLPGHDIEKALVRFARDDNRPAAERCEAIRALGKRGDSSAVRPLFRLARRNPSPDIRTAALHTLARLARPRDAAELVKRLAAARTETERTAAAAALLAACRRAENPGRAADRIILPRLHRMQNTPARLALVRILGKLGGEKSFLFLQKELARPNPEFQDAAARALADWPNPQAVPFLLKLAAAAHSPVRRTLCLRGAIRLLARAGPSRNPEQTAAWFRQALAAAQTPDEKRLALSGIPQCPSPATLALAQTLVTDPAVSAEAVAAVVAAAGKIAAADRSAAETALNAVLSTAPTADLKQQAQAALDAIQRYDDYITWWELSGPYSRGKKNNLALFSIEFPPEPGAAKSDRAAWRLLTPPEQPAKAWVVKLDQILGGRNRVAYLRSWLYSKRTHPVRFEIGSDDGVKAWLDGKVILEKNVNRGLQPDSDEVRLELTPGWHAVLLKITQGGGYWSACLRLRTPQGRHDPDTLLFGTARAAAEIRRILWRPRPGTPEPGPTLAVLPHWPRPGDLLAALLAAPDPLPAALPAPIEQAVAILGRGCANSAPAPLAAALKRIGRRGSPAFQTQLASLRRVLQRWQGYCRVWLVTGPYAGPPRERLFSTAFAPEPGGSGRTRPWKILELPAGPEKKNVVVDLNRFFGIGENCAAYLRTVIFAPKACRARLEIGSDDAVKVWLNGRLVHAMDKARPLKLGEDSAAIQLDQGANGLLVKIVQFGGDWQGAIRVCGEHGGPLPGTFAEIAGRKQPLWP